MSSIIINLFILLANIIAAVLIYHSIDRKIEKSKKILYIMVSMGIIYIFVLMIFSLSSIGIPKELAKYAKDMIIFTFVPVNSIIIVPFFLRTVNKGKTKELSIEKLNIRMSILAVIIILLFAGEYFYFRNTEKEIVDIVNEKQKNIIENNEKIESNNQLEQDLNTVDESINNSNNLSNNKNNII